MERERERERESERERVRQESGRESYHDMTLWQHDREMCVRCPPFHGREMCVRCPPFWY
jgi:hypothetical protein